MLLNGSVFVRNHELAVCLYLGSRESLTIPPSKLKSIADIPQKQYRDWASIVLSVEPELAMTSPSGEWLVRWFWITIMMGWVIAPLVGLVLVILARVIGVRYSFRSIYTAAYRTVAYMLGLVGTTVLGHWTGAIVMLCEY